MRKIIEAISSQPWLIREENFETIVAIAEGYGQDISALEKKVGRTLDTTNTVTKRDGTAIINITGPIFRYANLFTDISGATSTELLARDFAKAEDDSEVDRIILNIDSPGGQAPGIAEMATMVRESRTPVIAYIDGIAASAAYWIASAADTVIIGRASEAGSIGAMAELRVDNDGNKVTVISEQSPLKRPDPKTESGRKVYQERINSLAQVFVEDVASFRNVSVEKVLSDFGRGGILLGQAAVDAGLADRVGTFESLFGEEELMAQDAITIESLTTSNPEIVSALEKQGYDKGFLAGKVQGQQDEVARIQGVKAQSIPGHEATVEKMMFDGKSTGADVAIAIIQEQKVAQEMGLEAFRKNAPPVLEDIPAPDLKKDKKPEKMTLQEKWDNNVDGVADEFLSFDDYQAFTAANDKGLIKTLGGE